MVSIFARQLVCWTMKMHRNAEHGRLTGPEAGQRQRQALQRMAGTSRAWDEHLLMSNCWQAVVMNIERCPSCPCMLLQHPSPECPRRWAPCNGRCWR